MFSRQRKTLDLESWNPEFPSITCILEFAYRARLVRNKCAHTHHAPGDPCLGGNFNSAYTLALLNWHLPGIQAELEVLVPMIKNVLDFSDEVLEKEECERLWKVRREEWSRPSPIFIPNSPAVSDNEEDGEEEREERSEDDAADDYDGREDRSADNWLDDGEGLFEPQHPTFYIGRRRGFRRERCYSF